LTRPTGRYRVKKSAYSSMANDTLVRFINSTDQPLTIKPINSSVGRFERFTIDPGSSKELRGNNPGSNNYDLEWDPIINPKGKENDLQLGSLRADNPWGGNQYIQTLTDNTWFGGGNYYRFKSDGVTKSSSFYYKAVASKQVKGEEPYFYGLSNKSIMRKGSIDVHAGKESPIWREVNIYYTSGFLAAMNRETPIAKVSYNGLSGGAYNWEFNFGYQ